MNCHHCAQEVKLWQTFCPYCGARLQNNSFSTIAEAPVTVERQSRRQLLRKALQFVLLAITVIILASVLRLSPPQANPLPKEAAATAVAASPSPVPTPEPVIIAPPAVPAPAPSVKPAAKLQPIDLLADVFGLTPKSSLPKTRQVTVERTKKAKSDLLVTDEALPRKLLKPVAPPRPAAPEPEPAVPAPVEAAANLELDGGATLLQPNTGLVSIKSYVPARVYIDGVYSGVTPRSVKLLTGEHSISLMANGYHEYIRTIKVGGQQQIGILAAMSKK